MYIYRTTIYLAPSGAGAAGPHKGNGGVNHDSSRRVRIELPELPYPADALEPFISARTLRIHHDGHHRAYVDKANALVGEASGTLEEIIVRSAGDPSKKALFNNAAQAWNHAFYWQSLRPQGGSVPREFARFLEELKTKAIGHFGSGWVWLVREGGELKVVTTANADTPFVHGMTPLLVIDVWEHAYYLDRQERRADYVNAVVDHLLDWDFMAANLHRIEK
jgi:Fe-Mn family superoxide dismutase